MIIGLLGPIDASCKFDVEDSYFEFDVKDSYFKFDVDDFLLQYFEGFQPLEYCALLSKKVASVMRNQIYCQVYVFNDFFMKNSQTIVYS